MAQCVSSTTYLSPVTLQGGQTTTGLSDIRLDHMAGHACFRSKDLAQFPKDQAVSFSNAAQMYLHDKTLSAYAGFTSTPWPTETAGEFIEREHCEHEYYDVRHGRWPESAVAVVVVFGSLFCVSSFLFGWFYLRYRQVRGTPRSGDVSEVQRTD